MKKLSIILSFLICGITAFSQYPNNLTPLGSDSALSRFKGAVKGRLINFPFSDTTALNLERIKYYDGAQAYTNNGGGARFWLRDSTFNKWTEIVSGGASSIITIITDSSINICSFVDNATSVCDTFVTNNINAIANVEIINDSTLLVCDIEALCDTLHIPPRNFFGISANNGLTMSAPTNVQLGGQLIKNTDIDVRFQILTVKGKTIFDYPFRIQQNANFANSTAMQSWKSIGGISTEIDFNNAVQLGVNYTGGVYPASPTNFAGYMGDRIGYLFNVNATGNGSFGLRTDNTSSKLAGIMIHTLDTSYTDAITFFGKHPPNANYQAAPGVGSTGLQPYRSLTLHDNNKATFFGRMEEAMGANVAAANDLTIGLDGNLFTITGNTQVNAIATGNWQAGSEIAFIFTGTPILKNNTAGGSGTATMLLAGRIDFQAAAGDYIGFRYDGTNWYEINRKLAATVSAGLSTADNGLTANTATNVQLGGTLIKNTTIAAGGFRLDVTGNQSSILMQVIQTGSGNAIAGFGNGGSIGVLGQTTGGTSAVRGNATASGIGVLGTSITGQGGSFSSDPATTNTDHEVINIIRTTSGTASAGISGSIGFYVEDNSGSANSNQLISKWTTVNDATRVSEFSITGVNAAVTATLLTISGSGATALNKYGIGTFTGTPARGLAVDASGNIIEVSISSSGGTYTASNGLTMTANNVVLGGTALSANSTVPTSAFTFEFLSSSANHTLKGSNSSTGYGLSGTSTSGAGVFSQGGAYGVVGYSPSGTGAQAFSDTGLPLEITSNSATTNAVYRAIQINTQSTGTAANGLGGSIDFEIQTTTGTTPIANRLISRWTTATAASRVSEFSITGVNNAVTATLFTLAGSGAVRFNSYGVGGITGTSAFCLAVDASGNIIEVACAGPGGGSVNSVSGTANRITSTGGTDPILDISAAYVGQNTITIIGTIATGVWQGTAVGPTFGGTGLTSYTQGDLPYASAANTLAKLAIGTALQVLRVNAGATALEWATPGTGGTVTTVSIGNLSPLFTASVATATTTPAITFALSNAAANTWYGNNTSGSTTPSFNAFGTGVNTWMTTPTSANFAAAITNETGTAGFVVLSVSPSLTTPDLGTPSAATLTNATGLPVSTGISGLGTGIAAFLATPSSANFAAAITNEVGTGNVILQTNTTLVTPNIGVATATSINGNTFTTGTYVLTGGAGKTLTFNNTITLTGTDATTMTLPSTSATIARTDAGQTFTGNQVINGNVDFSNGLITKYGVTTTSQSGTTYTLLSTDNGTVVSFTSGSAVTVTLPAGLPTGFNCSLRQLGAGQVSISVSGTTMHNYNTETKTAGLYAVVNLIYESSNTYTLAGETGP